jgi:hypothetical protein
LHKNSRQTRIDRLIAEKSQRAIELSFIHPHKSLLKSKLGEGSEQPLLILRVGTILRFCRKVMAEPKD